MNKIETKTRTDKYIAVDDKTIYQLNKLKCLKCWTLYFYLCQHQTFKNGLVGIYKTFTNYDCLIHFKSIGFDADATNIKYYLKKLSKAGLITIFHNKPLIIQLVNSEFKEEFKDFNELLTYITKNEKEFQFDRFKKRKDEFYELFKLKSSPCQDEIGLKEKALDDLVKSRPTYTPTPISQQEQDRLAKQWAEILEDHTDIFEDQIDPFENHFKNI